MLNGLVGTRQTCPRSIVLVSPVSIIYTGRVAETGGDSGVITRRAPVLTLSLHPHINTDIATHRSSTMLSRTASMGRYESLKRRSSQRFAISVLYVKAVVAALNQVIPRFYEPWSGPSVQALV